jgi:methylmalonyl-CoA mutase C-terminal domain/subunit
MEGKKIRVLIAKPGLDGHERGVKVLAQGLRDAGMEVIYPGLRSTPEQIAQTAIQEDVDVVGLSCLSGAHMSLFPKTIKLIKEETDRILFIGGGIIPQKDIPALKESGMASVFGPGTAIEEIVDVIRASFGEKAIKEGR